MQPESDAEFDRAYEPATISDDQRDAGGKAVWRQSARADIMFANSDAVRGDVLAGRRSDGGVFRRRPQEVPRR